MQKVRNEWASSSYPIAARLGAHDFALTSNEKALGTLKNRFNQLIDTVSAPHDIARYAEMRHTDGAMFLLGVPEKPAPLPAFALIPRRRSIVGSLIGGIKETQAMLDFSAARGITADVETIPVQDIDRVYQRMLRGDVRYRFVIDAASLKGTGFRPAWIRPEVGMCSPPRSDC